MRAPGLAAAPVPLTPPLARAAATWRFATTTRRSGSCPSRSRWRRSSASSISLPRGSGPEHSYDGGRWGEQIWESDVNVSFVHSLALSLVSDDGAVALQRREDVGDAADIDALIHPPAWSRRCQPPAGHPQDWSPAARPADPPQPQGDSPLKVRRAPATRQQLAQLSSRSRRSKRQPGNWWWCLPASMDAMDEASSWPHRVHAARQPVPSSSQHSLSQPATRVRCRFGRLHRLRAQDCLHVPRTDVEDS